MDNARKSRDERNKTMSATTARCLGAREQEGALWRCGAEATMLLASLRAMNSMTTTLLVMMMTTPNGNKANEANTVHHRQQQNPAASVGLRVHIPSNGARVPVDLVRGWSIHRQRCARFAVQFISSHWCALACACALRLLGAISQLSLEL